MKRPGSILAAPLLLAFALSAATTQAQAPAGTPDEVAPAAKPPQTSSSQPPARTAPPKPPPPKPLEPPPGASGPPVRNIVIGAGVVGGVLLLGTGVIFTISSNRRASEADTLEKSLTHSNGPDPCRVPGEFAEGCNNLTKLRASQSRFAHIAIGTFAAGGAVSVGTLIYGLVTMNRPDTAAVQIRPVVGAGTAGLALQGRW